MKCSLFIAKGGALTSAANGAKRYSVDLPQGGLKVPCKLLKKLLHIVIIQNKFCMKNFVME